MSKRKKLKSKDLIKNVVGIKLVGTVEMINEIRELLEGRKGWKFAQSLDDYNITTNTINSFQLYDTIFIIETVDKNSESVLYESTYIT